MSIIGLAREKKDSPSGNMSFGKDSGASFTRTFLVTTNSVSDGPITVSYAAGVPADFSTWRYGTEEHEWAYLKKKDAKRYDHSPALGEYYWWVTCQYETSDEEENDDPLSDPPKISYDWEETEELLKGDYTPYTSALEGKQGPHDAVRNSAGEIFSEQPTRPVTHQIIRVTRNEHIATDLKGLFSAYENTVNKEIWKGYGGRSLRLRIKADVEYRDKGENPKRKEPYLKVTYEFVHRRDKWDLQLLDHGSYYLDLPNSTDKLPFLTENGEPFLGLLDGNIGKQSPDGNPNMITLQRYDEQDWSALDVPVSPAELGL